MQESLDKIKQYYDRGKAYLQNGQIENAIENLKKVIKLEPDFARAYLHLGAAYYALGQHEQAIDHIQKHLKLQPGNAMAYIALGNVYANIKQRRKAIRCYTKSAELQPNDATPYYCIGVICCQLGEYRKAIDNFKIAIDLHPPMQTTTDDFVLPQTTTHDCVPLGGRGLLPQAEKDEGEQPDSKASSTKSPLASLADIYINMGAAYIELKRYKQAILSSLKAVELQAKDVKAYNNLGVAYASLGQYDSAIEHFKHASKLQPSNAITHFNLGVIFSRLDKHNEAVSHFSRIIRESDAADDIQSSPLEVVYAELKQPGDFVMTRERVVEIQPDEDAKARSTLAEAYSGNDQYKASILSYKRVIELQPDNAEAYYNLGKLYFNHKEELQGIECFSKVIELQSDDEIYQKALDTILLFDDARVVKPLIFALKSNDKYSRLCSVSQLGKIGDERAIKPLIELLNDSDKTVCQYTTEALIKFGGKAVAPLIHALKSHKSESVRWYAAYILKQIDTSDALRALKDIGKQGAEDSKGLKKRLSGGIRQKKGFDTLRTKPKGYSRKKTLWSRFSGR